MRAQIIGTLLTTILLTGCGTHKTADHAESPLDTTKTANITENESMVTDSVVAEDDFDYSDCVRGQAQSVIKKAVYSNSILKLNPDHLTGTETVDLPQGERLIIRNWGCEYYVLTFRFETERFQADTTDIKYWLDKAVILMNEIEKGLDAPLNIQGGTLAAADHLKQLKDYALGEEIVYDSGDIRDFVTFDRIHKINNKKFAIEISYATGPL
jgi:hypothetical protein